MIGSQEDTNDIAPEEDDTEDKKKLMEVELDDYGFTEDDYFGMPGFALASFSSALNGKAFMVLAVLLIIIHSSY